MDTTSPKTTKGMYPLHLPPCSKFIPVSPINSISIHREGENQTFYYSTTSQLDELLYYLEKDGDEQRLLADLKSWYYEIASQMSITKQLTDSFKGNQMVQIDPSPIN